MVLFLLFICVLTTAYTSTITNDEALENVKIIISKYSSNNYLSLEEFRTFSQSLMSDDKYTETEDNQAWCTSITNVTTDDSCTQCSVGDDVFNKYANNSRLNSSGLLNALPALIMAAELEHCKQRSLDNSSNEEEIRMPRKPTTAEVWGYSLGVVLSVCLISNLGAFLTPLMDSAFFQKLLMFLVAIAIGTQAGAGILVLIPESLHLMYVEETKDTYLWKCCCVLGGIIFVLILERMLKICFHHKKSTKERTVAEISIEPGSTVTITTAASAEDCDKRNQQPTMNNQVTSNGSSAASNGVSNSHICKSEDSLEVPDKEKQQIATVAWMVMMGDAIHKFVDGLSVGAAFTENITTGLSLAISILCEELPHELGDVSILLHSGMTMKQALFYNTMSAAMGIPGLIVGIFVGETTSANQWIFAIAGGIFIYVPLADMLPEMGHAIDKSLKEETGAVFLCILQLLGLCIGFGIIILVAAYAGQIQL